MFSPFTHDIHLVFSGNDVLYKVRRGVCLSDGIDAKKVVVSHNDDLEHIRGTDLCGCDRLLLED